MKNWWGLETISGTPLSSISKTGFFAQLYEREGDRGLSLLDLEFCCLILGVP